jgi:phage host-nuclease inhibitor protein Gam
VKEIKNWDDVNSALRRMGELAIKKTVAAAAYKTAVDAAQAKLDKVKLPADKEYEDIEAKVAAFSTANKGTFIGKSRTRKLSFGKVQFKLSPGTVAFSLAQGLVIANLRKLGHDDCIRQVEEVDKDAVKNLDENDLLKAGIRIERADRCKAVPDLDKIREAVG